MHAIPYLQTFRFSYTLKGKFKEDWASASLFASKRQGEVKISLKYPPALALYDSTLFLLCQYRYTVALPPFSSWCWRALEPNTRLYSQRRGLQESGSPKHSISAQDNNVFFLKSDCKAKIKRLAITIAGLLLHYLRLRVKM